MSTAAAAPARAGNQGPDGAPPTRTAQLTGDAGLALGLGAALVALAFLTASSVDQIVTGAGTWSEIAVTALGAGGCAAAVVAGARGPARGAPAALLFAAFAALAALSITWSVQPDWSWFGADQLASYVAVFAGAVALGRVFPERWPAVIGGLAIAMTALSAWSLLAKVFPATLNAANTYGRVQAPFGYWNTTGLAAAMGVPACLWWATRRTPHWRLRAPAIPALTVLISVLVLSYSRSATLAAVIGIALWLAAVPLRLRSALVLGVSAVAAVPIVAWALGDHALSADGVPLPAQDAAGHSFGWVLLIMLSVAVAAGLAVSRGIDTVPVPAVVRRRVGLALLVGVALLPVLGVGALAASSRGLTGEISHAFSTLTSSSTMTTDSASRFSQLGSSRPLYWHQGLQVGGHALLAGVGELGYGVARLRYTTEAAKSDQAHSYLVQTFADLGLLGLALTLALLAAWAAAALRPLAPRLPWRSLAAEPARERAGLLGMAAVVLTFGIQTTLDWTWYFPGVAIPALLCAGWLAGRGPLSAPVGRRTARRPLRDRPGAGAVLTLLTAATLGLAWLMWQPLRSAQEVNAGVNATTNAAAFADARSAADADPLSIEPLYQLALLDGAAHRAAAGRAELTQATRIQPENPESWGYLASFDLQSGDLHGAIAAAGRVLALDHTVDPTTTAAHSVITAAGARLAAHRPARGRGRRRHR